MKTSIIDVPDMLSVLTVDELEKRFREVPGVESATVNYAARNATVRYDETLLDAADIKVLVHQRGQQADSESQGKDESGSNSGHKPENQTEHKHAEAPKQDAALPDSAAPKAAMSAPTAPAVQAQGVKPPPSALPSPAPAAPNA